MGFSAGKIHYLLLAVVAVVTVTSLESMGAIVAIAMLIVPGATAHLLTDRLRTMLPLSVVVSTLATIAGYVAAVRVNATVSGMVAVAAGVLFAFAVILAPQHGLLGRLANTLRLRLRIAEEDILGRLYRLQETRAAAGRETPTLSRHQCLQIAGGSWIGSLALWHLNRGGHIASAGDRHVQLTDSGRQLGQSILRAHRLWEAYINEHFELQEDHLHEPAHRVEHFIGPTLQDRLQAELADAAATDPHGQRIPPRPDSSNPDTRRSP